MHRYKIILSGLLCLLIVSVGSAADKNSQIQWRRNMKAAYKEAQATGKPMFVQFTADWCGYCKKMDKSTFSDPQVIDFVNQSFIPLIVDKERNEKFAQAVGVDGLPTTVIISAELEMIDKLTGFQSSWELTKALSSYQRSVPNAASLVQNVVEEPEPDLLVKTADVPPRSATVSSKASSKNVIAPSGYNVPKDDTAQPSDDRADFADDVDETFSSLESESREPMAPVGQERFEAEQTYAEESLPPLAFDGYCLVSALDDRQLVEGAPEFGVVYGGRMMFFASDAHREAFIAAPRSYWPANDGVCPVSTTDAGKTRPGHLKFATVYHHQLWLFHDEESRNRFMEHPQEYSRASQNSNPVPSRK